MQARPRTPYAALDPLFQALTAGAAGLMALTLVAVLGVLAHGSSEAFKEYGLAFITGAKWSPARETFGALPGLYGTLVTTLLALAIATPLSIAIALFLTELAPPRTAVVFGMAVELLAAVPSIIYGMWGFFVLAPFVGNVLQPALVATLGWLPIFRDAPTKGMNLLTASLILALMVLPFITAVTREVFLMTPPVLKEAAYGLGATTYEVVKGVILPHSLSGMVGGIFLGLGRAIGETMAVTFLIGNRPQIDSSLFSAGATVASTLANDFAEAEPGLHTSSLLYLALLLFMLSFLFQVAARLWLNRIRLSLGS